MKIPFVLFGALSFALPIPSASAGAEEREEPHAPPVYVELGRGYQHHAPNFPKGEGLLLRRRNRRPGSNLPERAQREAAFARVAELEAHLEKMDELDRDMLFVRAQRGDLPVLQSLYPDIPMEVLHHLADEVRKP